MLKVLKNSSLMGQGSRFFIVGLCCAGVDLSVYRVVSVVLPTGIAKLFGFVCGTCLSYIFNKLWTFKKEQQSGKELLQFAILYGGSMIANVATNHHMLTLTHENIMISFLAATGVSTVINFTGQRLWVFRQPILPGSH
jgi:putative flippase GtrA